MWAFWTYLLLELLGHRTFFDRGELESGGNFHHDISAALHTVRVGIVIIGHDFFDRDWCKREAKTLLEREEKDGGVRVYPVFLHSSSASMRSGLFCSLIVSIH